MGCAGWPRSNPPGARSSRPARPSPGPAAKGVGKRQVEELTARTAVDVDVVTGRRTAPESFAVQVDVSDEESVLAACARRGWATPKELDETLDRAVAAFQDYKWMPAWKRYKILDRASRLIEEHQEQIARLIAAGKPKLVAIIAVARKLLTILNAIIRDQKPWHQQTA